MFIGAKITKKFNYIYLSTYTYLVVLCQGVYWTKSRKSLFAPLKKTLQLEASDLGAEAKSTGATACAAAQAEKAKTPHRRPLSNTQKQIKQMILFTYFLQQNGTRFAHWYGRRRSPAELFVDFFQGRKR